MKVHLARDLNLAFLVIQRLALGANSQIATVPTRNFVVLTAPRRRPAQTQNRTFARSPRLPNYGCPFIANISNLDRRSVIEVPLFRHHHEKRTA